MSLARNRVKKPDLAGGYFRSDHFSFAKAGVPAFSITSGSDYLGDKQKAEQMRATPGQGQGPGLVPPAGGPVQPQPQPQPQQVPPTTNQ